MKEGKWIEYEDEMDAPTTDSTEANANIVTVYKDGKPIGVSRTYQMDGRLLTETPYAKEQKNGIEKAYYGNGKIMGEMTYSNDMIIAYKDYDKDGNEIKK